jgi:hypothetical protein
MVGGPNENDEYNDKRDDYISNEIAIDYNAGFTGRLLGWASSLPCALWHLVEARAVEISLLMKGVCGMMLLLKHGSASMLRPSCCLPLQAPLLAWQSWPAPSSAEAAAEAVVLPGSYAGSNSLTHLQQPWLAQMEQPYAA